MEKIFTYVKSIKNVYLGFLAMLALYIVVAFLAHIFLWLAVIALWNNEYSLALFFLAMAFYQRLTEVSLSLKTIRKNIGGDK